MGSGGRGGGMLRCARRSFQKSFCCSERSPSIRCPPEREAGEPEELGVIPEDVKEGHFTVMAISDGEPKRFVVSLSCLSHPEFLRLLEQAGEEFGFHQKGALAIPCYSGELEKILREI